MIQTPSDAEDTPRGVALDWTDPSTLPVEDVKALFVVLGKALRAHQLYDENNPVYQRFISQFGEAMRSLWGEMDRLPISVYEDRFTWMGEVVYESSSRADSLAFLLFKDGIREFTLHEGLETHELTALLKVLNRAKDLRLQGDDLLTILWEEDLKYFTYSYIDLRAEGMDLDLPASGQNLMGGFERIIREELGDAVPKEGELSAAEGEGRDGPSQVRVDDFNPTLYSLDPTEMGKIQEEIRIEMNRDLREDVLSALFDRVEEPRFPERQGEILEIFQILLPNFLGRGALSSAGAVLEELARLLASEEALQPGQRATAEEILEEVSGAAMLRELVQSLEDGSISPDPGELSSLLRHLRADALGPLLRGAEEADNPRIKLVIQNAVKGIARKYPEALLDFMDSEDPVIVAGALGLAGKMELKESASRVGRLLSHDATNVRLAAIEAAMSIKVAAAVGGLKDALSDQERDVRIAAARAVGNLRFRPAASYLRDAIEGKEIRQADISEQIAFFES
ncbi:MAG: HEAT repeat domain-containing protein, partial [Longimicrobiales bacterium]|nr:HEAT repeat domain-containing protein [Longimicrobiales bacterium]